MSNFSFQLKFHISYVVIIQMFICKWEMNLQRNGIVISDSKYVDTYFNMWI